ncbi:DegV family protein [Gracilibacillus alcaliphilus]|uniref:DegV family protein n=1 Tax=Gracilibacillus alcaliphilus TaxID=1401441 RepID=UPI00195D86FD|nr:DegV family protein [Gracilibacillus alcaliphilus]MBM7675376.1 DegV family protein with EDD domain [Gracilibacillus alcaliphilus]
MTKIAWVTDSTCGLDQTFAKKNDIFIIPLHVIVNGVSYREDIDLSKEAFYEKLKVHGEGAKTSQPAFGDFVSLYEQLQKDYDMVIAIHASSKLTGTYQSSVAASDMYDIPVHVVDSKIGDFALGQMIKKGIKLADQGLAVDEIVRKLQSYPSNAQMYLMPQSFEQMRRSGRVSAAQSLFASLLKLHLILGFEDGKVVVKDKVRIKKRAKLQMFHLLEEAMETYRLKEICISHAGVIEQANQWKTEITEKYSELKVHVQTLVPVAGVHTGHGTMCISWLRD